MKVLHVHWRCDSYGGGERYLHGICRSQKEAGYRVATISDRRFGAAPEFASGKDAQYLIDPSMGIRTGWKEMRNVLRIVESESPDLVHLHHTASLISPLILREIVARYPTVKTVHDASLLCPHTGERLPKVWGGKVCEFPSGIGCLARRCQPVFPGGLADLARNVWEKRVSRRIGTIVVSSRFMESECRRNRFPEGKIAVLPLYVERQDPGPPTAAAAGTEGRTLLFVGRLDASKGISHFLEALCLMRDEAWEAEIVGEGPEGKEIEKKIRDAGMGGRVALHGKVPAERMGGYYRRALLLAMPSLIPESFGLVGVEAMSFGKPVVAYDSGGIREWLADGVTGFLVERGNVRALSEKMTFLLKDRQAAAAMGSKGKERADALYGKSAHLRRLQGIYLDAMGGRR